MRCASITVTFNPDPALVVSQLRALPDTWLRLVVDNGTADPLWAPVEQALADLRGIEVLRLGGNLGLAAAQNRGMQYLAEQAHCSHVLLLDQDSEPLMGSAEVLAAAYATLALAGHPVGAVGPSLRDPQSGMQHGFHRIAGWRWVRIFPAAGIPVACEGLNGSGTFMALDTALALGGMDEDLFIDHVDTDWSFRLLAAGYCLFGVPDASFLHRMGDETTRLWLFGWRVWPVRSPLRHRYLFRNAVLLLRRPHVPHIWKCWAMVKLLLTMGVFAISGPQRVEQTGNMLAGIIDGVRGRSGKL